MIPAPATVPSSPTACAEWACRCRSGRSCLSRLGARVTGLVFFHRLRRCGRRLRDLHECHPQLVQRRVHDLRLLRVDIAARFIREQLQQIDVVPGRDVAPR